MNVKLLTPAQDELDARELHSRRAQLQRYDIAPHPDEATR
jgi:hypothetical protein